LEKSTSSAKLKGKLVSFAQYEGAKVYFNCSGEEKSITTTKTEAAYTGEFAKKISGLEPDTAYNYKFIADFYVKDSTVSVNGNELLFVTYQLPPQKVKEGEPGYEDYLPEIGETSVKIKWKGRPGHSYRVEREGIFISSETASSIATCKDTGLMPDTEYSYKVFSINSAGEYDENTHIEIIVTTAEAVKHKAVRSFITPSNPELKFGEAAKEVIITDVRGNEVFRKEKDTSRFIIWNPGKRGTVSIESGIYIYRIRTDKGYKYGTVVVAK